jgi:hypothetical protein
MSKSSNKSVIRGITASSWKAVTPSDTTDLPEGPCSALWINVGGDVRGISPEGDLGTFTVAAGSVSLAFQRIYSTGTTATGIYALY